MAALRIGVVDTGVNPWHSHVGGRVSGCRVFVGADGRIEEDGDFRDACGHGTAVAAILREAFPDAFIFAARVFDDDFRTYPSLVARGMLRAAAAGCDYVNVSLSAPPDPASDALAAACAAIVRAGCVVVVPMRRDRPDWLPASLPGVHAVTADDALANGEVREWGPRRLSACGRPRDLTSLLRDGNFNGASFACARALVHLARCA
ncbi:MAG: S8 family serine peptidase [Rudaea sp.]